MRSFTRRSRIGPVFAFALALGAAPAVAQNVVQTPTTPMELPVEGRVVSPLTVSPASLFLGVLKPGETVETRLFVKGSKPLAAGEDVLVPGEPEDRYRAERLKDGIPLPDDTWASLLAIAREVGIDGARLQKIELL